jgi:hypothetical protein
MSTCIASGFVSSALDNAHPAAELLDNVVVRYGFRSMARILRRLKTGKQ